MTVFIEIVSAVAPELVEAFQRLTPQLSRSNPPPGEAELEEIVAAPATDLFVATDDEAIVGVATLAVFRIPTGRRAWIEDVIVDEASAGKGIGGMLVRAMTERARELGCSTVDLTSRPSRAAANRLYLREGFALRETNVYRLELEARDPGT